MAITLTERAAEHVKRVLNAQESEVGLRVRVKTTGCSGYAYVIEPARSVADQDSVFQSNGVRLVVDAQSLPFIQGSELDYVREGLNSAFKFRNPNVQDTCGCGESFSVARS
ncbi:MAG: HesB/IscA family protein [Gammaproteobacteria bacterium]